MAQITYQDKVAINTNSNIADINKVNASDMNEIKNTINGIDGGTDIVNNLVVGSIKTKNLFDSSTLVQGDVAGANLTLRLSSRQALWLEVGTYTFNTNMANTYRYGILIRPSAPPTSSASSYDSGWQTNSSITFTISTAGYYMMNISRTDNTAFTSTDLTNLYGYNYQLEKGSTATAFTNYQNLNPDVSDSGWIYPTLTTNFKNYNNNSANSPKYRKIGKIVTVQGIVTTTSTIASTSDQTIFTLPSSYTPSMEIRTVCQGSGMNRWMLSIATNGNVCMTRYGITTQDSVSSGTWLPFCITYFID